MSSKTKKMFWTIPIIYFSIVLILYYLIGGFFFTKTAKKDAMVNKALSTEFAYFDKQKVQKGVFAGEIEHTGKKHYNLQFSGLLEGENRFLNIYQAVEDDIDPYIFESDSAITGKAAFLMYDYIRYGMDVVTLYEELFKNELQENPYHLLDTIGEERSLADDKLILLSWNIVGNSLKTESIVWDKKVDSTFSVQRNTALMYAREEDGTCKVHNKQRNAGIDKLRIIGAAFIDILTAPFQAIIIGIYLIMVILAGGPVK